MDHGESIIKLLEESAEAAWRHLVDEYSGLMLAVIGRYTPLQDDRMDAYLYVLQELANDDMRRIRHYGHGNVERTCQFSTWLKLVVRNLFFDWFRHKHGRRSEPKEIKKLEQLDRSIFKLVYWDGYAPREAFEILRTRESALDYQRFLEGLSEVDARLTGINRAKIHRDYLKWQRPLSLDKENDNGPPLEAQAQVEQEMPDEATSLDEQRQALSELLAGLSAEDRLVLRLRFYEGLTAREIAAAIGSPDPMAIYRRIERICKELSSEARSLGTAELLREADGRALADADPPPELDGDLGRSVAAAIPPRESP